MVFTKLRCGSRIGQSLHTRLSFELNSFLIALAASNYNLTNRLWFVSSLSKTIISQSNISSIHTNVHVV